MSSARRKSEAIRRQALDEIELLVIHASDGIDLTRDALDGDGHAAQALQVLGGILDRVDRAPKRRPALCATCPKPLDRQHMTAVGAVPRQNPTAAVGFAVCPACAPTGEEAVAKGLEALRQLWPGWRGRVVVRRRA